MSPPTRPEARPVLNPARRSLSYARMWVFTKMVPSTMLDVIFENSVSCFGHRRPKRVSSATGRARRRAETRRAEDGQRGDKRGAGIQEGPKKVTESD
eukprot:1002106-Prorocentrum_minimum.AAC.1